MHIAPPPTPDRASPLSHPPLLAAAAVLLAGGALLHGSARDTALFHLLNALGTVWPALWAMLSVAGLGLSAFIVLAALHRDASARLMRPVAALLWCFPVGGALTHVLKRLIAHPRPAAALGVDQIVVIGEPLMRGAMPSGHAIRRWRCSGCACWPGARRGCSGRGCSRWRCWCCCRGQRSARTGRRTCVSAPASGW